ncbi:MAG TPA: hypothetical protein VK699_12630 [Terriglobales bacterium]|nr:hypothetical protein [Terriglobales bacterium]
MKRTVISSALAFALFFCAALWAKEIHFNNGSSVAPGAAGRVDVDKDRNGNTELKIHVYHLADPEKLSPPKTVYVVWVQPPGKSPVNTGQLKVNGDLEGTLTATTPFKAFDTFITAEDNAHVDAPSGPEVLRTTVER